MRSTTAAGNQKTASLYMKISVDLYTISDQLITGHVKRCRQWCIKFKGPCFSLQCTSVFITEQHAPKKHYEKFVSFSTQQVLPGFYSAYFPVHAVQLKQNVEYVSVRRHFSSLVACKRLYLVKKLSYRQTVQSI